MQTAIIHNIHSTHVDDQMLMQVEQIEQLVFDDAWQCDSIKSTLSQFGAGILLMMQQGEVLGYCIYQIVFENAEVLRIATKPCIRKRGIASQLLSFLCQYCQSQQAQTVMLEVSADNLAAIGLYQKHHFKQIDLRKNYYRTATQSIDALIFVRQL